ncbi:MAG: tetratricopeptide repeat protein [Elainellaceae cyanobacterium]
MPQMLSTRKLVRRALAIILIAWVLLPIHIPEASAGLFGSPRRGPRSVSGRRRGGGVRSGRLLGGVNPAIPYVISPRHTWLEDDAFTIEWNPVENASSYTVSVWRWSYARDERDLLVWQTTTTGTQVVYPGAPNLELGRYYSVEVVTDTGASSTADAGDARSGFQLLFSEDLALLQRDRRRIERVDLSAEERAFFLAALYTEERLYHRAIEVLMPLAQANIDDPWIYKALGDVHSYIGLNQRALDHYQEALQAASGDGVDEDSETRAIVLTNLGSISATIGRVDDAIAYFQQAQSIYHQQQRNDTVTRLQQRIELLELQQPSETSRTNVQMPAAQAN